MSDLPSGWALRSIESICDRVTSGGTPSRRRPEFYTNGTIDWYKTGELRDQLLFGSEERITQEALDNSSAKVFPVDTVLLALYGDGDTITTLGLLKKPGATNQACCAMIVDAECADPRYLFYALKHTRLDLLQRCVGGAQRNLSGKLVREHQIPVPPLAEQRSIAAVLGALDDKIEQNRQTVRALEELAWTTFKAWFVDFEPIKAKAAGQTSFPGMPDAAFAVLPDALTDSSLGPVPTGWAMRPLSEVADFLNGLALQKYPPADDKTDLPVIKIAELRKGSAEGGALANADVPNAYVVNNGDLLFSWSGTLEVELWFGGRGALNQHLFKVTSASYPRWLCLHWVRQHLPEFRLIASSKATTMGHIKRGHLATALVAVPDKASLQAADDLILPLYDLHASLALESRTLAKLRDYLLPQLVSGRVRMREFCAEETA